MVILCLLAVLEELAALFEATKNHYLGLLFQVTAFYGLRRSEVLGLKWDAIDFENKTNQAFAHYRLYPGLKTLSKN